MFKSCSVNKYSINYFINLFHAIGLFLYPLKTSNHEILPLFVTKTLIYCGHYFMVQINEEDIVLITENPKVSLLFPCSFLGCYCVMSQTIPMKTRSITKRNANFQIPQTVAQVKNLALKLYLKFHELFLIKIKI